MHTSIRLRSAAFSVFILACLGFGTAQALAQETPELAPGDGCTPEEQIRCARYCIQAGYSGGICDDHGAICICY